MEDITTQIRANTEIGVEEGKEDARTICDPVSFSLDILTYWIKLQPVLAFRVSWVRGRILSLLFFVLVVLDTPREIDRALDVSVMLQLQLHKLAKDFELNSEIKFISTRGKCIQKS